MVMRVAISQPARYFDSRAESFSATAWVRNTSLVHPFGSALCSGSDLLILDAGGGPGALARFLTGLCPQHRYVNLDLSVQMARCAQAAGISSAAGDIRRLPVRKASADVIIARQVLHYTEHPDAVLTEFRRALKPEGRLLFGQFAPENRDEQNWIRGIVTVRQPLRIAYPTVEEWRSLLRSAGFDVIRYTRVPVTESLKSWLRRYPCSPLEKKRITDLFEERRHRSQFPRIWRRGSDFYFRSWFSFFVARMANSCE